MSGDCVATKAIELELLEVKNRLGETVINMGSTICLNEERVTFWKHGVNICLAVYPETLCVKTMSSWSGERFI